MGDRSSQKTVVTKNWMVALSGFAVTLVLYLSGVLHNLDNSIAALNFKLTRHAVDADVVLVEIDSYSIKQLKLWPWPRSYHARVLERLHESGANKIFFDVDFSAPSEAGEDAEFARALGAFGRGQIMLPTFLQYTSSQANRKLSLIQPLPLFADRVTPVSVNLKPDPDGLVRRINLFSRFADVDLYTAPALFHGGDIYDADTLLIDFSIDPGSFRHISYADVYSGNYPSDLFADKHVIVGATALELSDQIPVPVYQSLPGPVVQALAYQTLIAGKLKNIDKPVVVLLVALMQLCIMFLLMKISWRTGLAIAVSVTVGWLLLGQQLLIRGFLLDTSPLLIFPWLSFVFMQLARIDEQALRLFRQRMSLIRQGALMATVVENTGDGILTLNDRGIIKSVNPAAKKMFGYTGQSPVNHSISTLIPILMNNGMFAQGYTGKGLCEDQGRHLSAELFPIEFSVNRLPLADQILYTVFVRDITERKARQMELSLQATHDSLTGLFNRAALKNRLQKVVQEYVESQYPAALLFVDLDRFKEINDTLGHGAGDRILHELGERLESLQSDDIFVARIGGDEFGVLLTGLDATRQAEPMADELVTLIKKPFVAEAMSLQVQASIGIAHLPEHTQADEELMMFADVAMYQAKINHLDYVVYDASLDSNTLRNLAISSQLNLAVDDEQFILFYQPKVDINSNEVVCLEALVRWVHPTLGTVAPDDFINVAERSGMIKPLTLYTLKAAMSRCRRLRAQGYNISMAVNLSAFLLQDMSLVDDLKNFLTEYSVDPAWLELEITESAIVDNPERAFEILKQIRALDIRLSIDDFGTGYASLSYLKQLPIQELKMDKLFINELLTNQSDQIIVRSTVELSHSLGLKVVAEGVESSEIYDFLREAGCDIAQGYWISPPLPSAQLETWLEQWRATAAIV